MDSKTIKCSELQLTNKNKYSKHSTEDIQFPGKANEWVYTKGPNREDRINKNQRTEKNDQRTENTKTRGPKNEVV